jgi:Txe/YoeB family toxin of Txe-Axe toxin-antitoxin module
MKIFISWSGVISRQVAEIMGNWLRDMFELIEPFESWNIDKGKRWSEVLTQELQSINFGIICVTKDNLKSPWLNFEAGALSKLDKSKVCTILFGIDARDLAGPLEQFQGTKYEKEDIWRLVVSIKNEYNSSLDQTRLRNKFDELYWQKLDEQLQPIYEKTKKSVIWILETPDFKADEQIQKLARETGNITQKTYLADQLPEPTESYSLVVYIYSQSDRSQEKLRQTINLLKSLPEEPPLVVYAFNRRLDDEEFKIVNECQKYKLAQMPDILIQRCQEYLS